MQAYLMYGYGINPSKITEDELRKLTELKDSEKMFCWYNEKDMTSITEGIYYLVSTSPFDKNRTRSNKAWSANSEDMELFKKEKEAELEEVIKNNHLESMREHIKFHCSCFSI